MGRRLRYCVATSLDGFIAAEDGGHDWIIMDPEIDFAGMAAEFDTYLMGRGTYEVASAGGAHGSGTVYVVSTTLDPDQHPQVTIISEDVEGAVRDLKAQDGKDIWLFGGGMLFRSLLEVKLVDTVELGVMPTLLGDGIPMLPGLDGRAKLKLQKLESLSKSGIVGLVYDVDYDA